MKLKLTRRKANLLVLVLTVSVLVIPWVMRWISGNFNLMGQFPYHHLHLSEHPELLFQPRFFTPYDLILFLLNSLIETEAWSVILPLMLGVGTVLLFNSLLRDFDLTEEKKFFILAFFILSPAFIYFYTFSNQYSLIIFLLLLVFNILKIKSSWKYLAAPLVLMMPCFDWLTTFITLGALLVYYLLKKEKAALYLIVGLAFLLLGLQLFFPQPLTYEPNLAGNVWRKLFSDLGGLKGIGFFSSLLAVIGLIVTWKERKVYYFVYPGILVLLLIFIFINFHAVAYINFFIAYFAGLGLMWLWKRKWKLGFLKNLSILVLILGVILSTAGYAGQISQLPPNDFVQESLQWLKDNAQPDEIVLSHPEKSFWIRAEAEQQVFLDSFDPDYQKKLNIAEAIFYSRDIDLTTELLEKNQITYIWIDTEMLRGQVWHDENEGLLFLFRNLRFRNVYNERGIEIWRFD